MGETDSTNKIEVHAAIGVSRGYQVQKMSQIFDPIPIWAPNLICLLPKDQFMSVPQKQKKISSIMTMRRTCLFQVENKKWPFTILQVLEVTELISAVTFTVKLKL